MQTNYFTVEVQRESPDFSDAKTVGEFADVRTALAFLQDESRGHRRLIGWIDGVVMRTPVELLRL